MPSDRGLTLKEMDNEFNLRFYALQSILNDILNILLVFVKFILISLPNKQKEHRLQMIQKLLCWIENDSDFPTCLLIKNFRWKGRDLIH